MSYHNGEVYIIEKKDDEGNWIRNTPVGGVFYTSRQNAQHHLDNLRMENAERFIIQSSHLTATIRRGAKGYVQTRNNVQKHIDFCASMRITTLRRA